MPRHPFIPPWPLLAICLAAGFPATGRANVPGGGDSGPNVSFTETGTTATLANGIITATINKAKATVTSMLFNGVQQVGTASGDSTIYFSMDGGTSYENPANCLLTVTANTGNMVDIALKQTWTSGTHPVDWEIHYVLRRGAKGLYVYAALSHPAAYPALTIGEWRMVWKLPKSSTDWYFENGYVDDMRYHEFPNVTDLANDSTTQIAEITKMNTGRRAGHYYGKYEFAAEYFKIRTWGHASDVHDAGTWIVLGGDDFFNDGPIKEDLTVDTNYHLIHFGRNHFNASSTVVPAGTAWRKMYGPYLLYCNTGTNAAACWADARTQAAAEKAAWPYSWVTHPDYPTASARGTVTGRYKVSDPLKPNLTGAGAWVGLAQPDASGSYTWQFDSLNYQYWVRADAAGNFTIPAVRIGDYTLYAFSNGATGEFSQAGVTVTAGVTSALGDLTRTISRTGTHLAWEIGTPDRDFKEFRHGKDYWIPYQWKNFATEWTNPLNLNATTGNWTTDWNAAHGVYETGGTDLANGTYASWKWNVNFNLASKPSSGNALLTIAFAGSHSGRMYLYVNSSSTRFTDFYPSYGGGNALLRQSLRGKYALHTISIPVSALKVGANTITLQQASTSGNGNYFAYDYVALEMPGTVPAQPPATGRNLVWTGGLAEDAWDTAAANWMVGGSPATFGAGDAVAFSSSGEITLANVLHPASVTVNSALDHSFAGPGSLAGTMPFTKSGAGTLTLANAGPNTFNGGATLTGGIVAVGDPGLLGTGAITFNGGHLRLDVDGFPLANDLNLTGAGRITAPAGGGSLDGALTGSAALTLDISAAAVLAATDNLAGFTGTLVQSGGGTLRLDEGGAAIAFDTGTSGTLDNQAATAANIALGALTGGASAKLAGSTVSGDFTDTYTLGGRNTDTTFAGRITDGTGFPTPHAVAITKTGSATLTLAGANTYTGPTTIDNGTLALTGSLASPAVTIATAGRLAGTGTLAGQVTCHGTLAPGVLTISNNLLLTATASLEFDLSTTPDRIDIAGNLTLAGTLHVTALPGLGSGAFTLFTYTGTLANPDGLALGPLPAGFLATIDTATPGQIRLVVTTPFEQWQTENFGITTDPDAAPTADPDGDGTLNDTEFRLGLDPKSGASSFRATGQRGPAGFTLTWPSAPGLVFEIRRNTTPGAEWELLDTLPPATPGPGTFTDANPPPARGFYRIVLLPGP